MIDLERGGHTARMMVVPRYAITTSQGKETLNRVRDDAQASPGRRNAGRRGRLSASQLSINDTLRGRTTLAGW